MGGDRLLCTVQCVEGEGVCSTLSPRISVAQCEWEFKEKEKGM